jgi:hypothetical protein
VLGVTVIPRNGTFILETSQETEAEEKASQKVERSELAVEQGKFGD